MPEPWQIRAEAECWPPPARRGRFAPAGVAPGRRSVDGGLLLLYGPFFGGGVATAPSNAAFDAHLRSLDPTMGLRDAQVVTEQAFSLGLEALADGEMPANNRILVYRKRGSIHSSIDISSVSHLNNVDDAGLIINKVDNSKVALTETIEVRSARELFRP